MNVKFHECHVCHAISVFLLYFIFIIILACLMGKADLKQEILEYCGILHSVFCSCSGYLQGMEAYLALYCSIEILTSQKFIQP